MNLYPVSRNEADTIFKMLIVTSRELAPVYRKLADWKSRKGMRTKILIVEDIYASDDSDDPLPVKIKRVLADYYYKHENTSRRPEYILLGGGSNIVPVQKCLTHCQNQVDTIPTDIFYASYKSIDWDSNRNGNAGETVDTIDIMPDVSVGRIPLLDSTEVSRVVDNILKYEQNPDVDRINRSILLCGMKYGNILFKEDNTPASDSQCMGEWIYNNCLPQLWDASWLYDTYTNINGMAGFYTGNVNSCISKGYPFVHVDTHGSDYGWATTDGNYSIFDANAQKNIGRTVITTSSCSTNSIDLHNYLGSAFFSSPEGGILGYWGCSRETFFGNYQHVPTNFHFTGAEYCGEFYKSLFAQENVFHRLGLASKNMRSSFMNYLNNESVPARWYHFGFNLLGDPELPVYTAAPTKFSNVNISKSEGHININPHEPSTACLVVDDFGISDYQTISYYGNISFPYNYGRCDICVTNPNYIPYQAVFNDIVYLQNESFLGADQHVLATDKTFIGSDVNSYKDYGPVTIEAGSTQIQLSNGVTITKDFEVKKGAELTIN